MSDDELRDYLEYSEDKQQSQPGLLSEPTTIPSTLRTKRKRPWSLVAGGVLIVLVAVLIVQATASTGAYFLTVDEVLAQSATMQGERVRVNGLVVDGSEDWNIQDVTLRFEIEDEGGGKLPIVFYGPRPDNFQRAASAIVEGEMLADGTFQADTLLLKCPSRYEEEPEEVFVQATR